MLRRYRKGTAAFIAAALVIGTFPAGALAAGTQKEEVIYANLSWDGSVDEVNAVNSFHLENGGKITDYGDYESLRNMTTTEEINYTGRKITVDTSSADFYYEGRMKDVQLPWNISIGYILDGKNVTADELAGESGKLEIDMEITENKACGGNFTDALGLQVTLLLDSDKADNIKAEGATVANAGKNRQLTYTVLPGNSQDICVTCDVRDFEMEKIQINAVKMNLDISIDMDSLNDKLDEVTGGVQALNDGASELAGGLDEIDSSMRKLGDATGDLRKGISSLSSGMTQLHQGLSALNANSSMLTKTAWSAYDSVCFAAQVKLNEFLKENGMPEVVLTPETYGDVIDGLLQKLDKEGAYKKAYSAALAQVKTQAGRNEDKIYEQYIASQADDIYYAYVKSMENQLYMQAASQAVMLQLKEQGVTDEDAAKYIKRAEGQALIEQTAASLTEEQKSAVLSSAAASLSDTEKQMILKAAKDSLTAEQKEEIKSGYIEQAMASEEVTDKINAALKDVNDAAASLAEIKAGLDGYGAFCSGIEEYTAGVSRAEEAAAELDSGLDTLLKESASFEKAMKKLSEGIRSAAEGSRELSDGTQELADGVSSDAVSDEISSITDNMTGADQKIESFTSQKNTNVTSVQFVIQADGVEKAEPEPEPEPEKESRTFLDKLLDLFR